MKVSSRKKPPPQQQREETEEQGSSGAAEAMDAAAAAAVQEEAEAEAEAEAEGRTVLVGVRADAESRALLTWVLVNVAAPLDRVVAVHVAPPSAAEAVDFDAMLAVYEGFCNLKQINLNLKICKDSSVRKALVREASLFGAAKVVLGVAKKRRAISSSHSVAKYCAKKLPAKCAVLAVSNGKIEFRRESSVHPDDGEGDATRDFGTKGSELENLSTDQVEIDADPSSTNAEESTVKQGDEISELPGKGASVLYCVLPERSSGSVASTSSRQDQDSVDLPSEGAGELYCLLPPRNGHSVRSIGDSKRSNASQKDDKPANPSLEGDGDLYCRLPRTGRPGRNSGGSNRSAGIRGAVRRSSSFSSDIHLSSETSPIKKDGSVSMTATERSSSAVSTEAEDSPKYTARTAETPSSSPMSLRRMVEGRSDRCHLHRRIFRHQRSSSFEWAKISMVQWAMRLPSRYTSVHPDGKPLKPGASPRLNCDSETESTAAVEPESMFSFAFYDVAWPPSELESLREKYSSVCRMFSYEELKLATSNYSPDMLIGKGGTSQVFKAQLDGGTFAAIKILKPSVDAIHEFVTEVETVTSLQHENIVALRGFSFENYNLVLAYDYMPRGSLDKALHGKNDGTEFLVWERRIKIAIDIARALEFLHLGGVTQSVIHGDVKSSNILLSEDFGARLCDFGLAKRVSASTPHLTCTDITGTFGYMAPEYFSHGEVNEKIDVYAFGVVLLEIVSGRRPITPGSAKGQESLVGWAKPLLSSGGIKHLVDPFLGNDYDCDEMERMTLAASLCTRTSWHSRPEMSLVLKLLQGDDETMGWARSASFDGSDEEAIAAGPDLNMQSHLSLALLGVDADDTLSRCSSTERTSADGYWSRSSSFD
uniref:Protein kinase domain-containing protein n=1 Tax=Zea mays TaxID=4577 RepID=A0A804P691_MAIZE